jgi:hypothetical protein
MERYPVRQLATTKQIIVWQSIVLSVESLSWEHKMALCGLRLERSFSPDELCVFNVIAHITSLEKVAQNELFRDIVFKDVWSFLYTPKFYAAFEQMHREKQWPPSRSHPFLETWVFCMVRA